MRRILLLSALLLAGFTAAAQSAAAPFKGANSILLQTPDSSLAALKKLGQILVSQGYTIRKFDKEFSTLQTEPRAVKQGAVAVFIVVKAVAEPGGLRLRAEGQADMSAFTPGQQQNAQPLTASGPKPRRYFADLISTAQAYPGAVLRYDKQ